MTTQAEMLAADLGAIMAAPEDVAVDATYTPKGGTGAAIKALYEHLGTEPMEGGVDGTQWQHLARLVVLASDVADPAIGDAVEVDGSADWKVYSVARRGEAHHTLAIVRHEIRERTASDGRVPRSINLRTFD